MKRRRRVREVKVMTRMGPRYVERLFFSPLLIRRIPCLSRATRSRCRYASRCAVRSIDHEDRFHCPIPVNDVTRTWG